MCIVTYLPLSGESFILVSSREEIASRNSTPPSIYKSATGQVLFPKDPLSNGTWIAASDKGKAVCLLNGAFNSHDKKTSYKHSRGLIPLKYLEHKSFMNFYFQYDLREIEPFTLIAFEDKSLFELRWDGQKHFVKTLLHKVPHIWSSVSLYSGDIIAERANRFLDWTNSSNKTRLEDSISFHKVEKNSSAVQTHEVKTLSLTALLCDETGIKMLHEDFETGIINEEVLKF